MIPRSGSPEESAEAFGWLCAALEDPFADRARVLADVGLTAASHAALEERWMTRLRGENAEALAQEIGRGYQARKHAGEPEHRRPQHNTPALDGVGEALPALGSSPAAAPAPEPPVPVDVPTFMQERSRPAAAEPQALSASTPEPPAASASAVPLAPGGYTETRELDLSKLLGPTVPFRPDAGGGSSATLSQPSSPMDRPARSGETAEIDVSAIAGLLVRPARALEPAPPAGAAPPSSSAPAASPGAPMPAPPGKRWVRFDPQTGKPLATPVLEDIPVAPGTAPPAPPSAAAPYTAETIDVDPALIAEVLRRGAAPFRR